MRLVYASEVVLNTALSVTVPETQSGNPGDFLTYVLILQNRSANPANLEVEYFSQNKWNIIGEPTLTVPAQTSNYYFPLTIMIPPNAPANIEELIQVRFKLAGQVFALPTVTIPVQVNPVAEVNFTVPPSLKGIYGSTVIYQIIVTNNGNSVEQFRGQSLFPTILDPKYQAFEF